jgi:hypothetical protein
LVTVHSLNHSTTETTVQLVSNVSPNQSVVKSLTNALLVPTVTSAKSTVQPSSIHANLVYSANNTHQLTTLVYQNSPSVPSVTLPTNALKEQLVLTALALPSKTLASHVMSWPPTH